MAFSPVGAAGAAEPVGAGSGPPVAKSSSCLAGSALGAALAAGFSGSGSGSAMASRSSSYCWIGDRYYENLDPQKVDAILEGLK